MGRVYNFSAGPAVLPEPVLKEAAEEDDLKEIALNNLVKDWLVENCIQVAGE